MTLTSMEAADAANTRSLDDIKNEEKQHITQTYLNIYITQIKEFEDIYNTFNLNS